MIPSTCRAGSFPNGQARRDGGQSMEGKRLKRGQTCWAKQVLKSRAFRKDREGQGPASRVPPPLQLIMGQFGGVWAGRVGWASGLGEWAGRVIQGSGMSGAP